MSVYYSGFHDKNKQTLCDTDAHFPSDISKVAGMDGVNKRLRIICKEKNNFKSINNIPQRQIVCRQTIQITEYNIAKLSRERGGPSVHGGQRHKPKLDTCYLQFFRQHSKKSCHLSITDLTTWGRDY